jgi:FKBP-type peptidyl-prolyl cis-trans isomerase FkpA
MPISKFFAVAVFVGLAGLATGCISPTGPSVNVPFSAVDVVVGTGASADAGDSITVDYTGWLYDPDAVDHKGLQFESTIGASPFTFTLGAGQVIDGWDEGVPGMQVGGTRRLVIPPALGYGPVRRGAIPANATLVFDITLNDAP